MGWGENRVTSHLQSWVRIDLLEAQNKTLRDQLAEARDELEGERHLRDQAEAVVQAAADDIGEANRLSIAHAKAEGELAQWRDLANLRGRKIDEARDILADQVERLGATMDGTLTYSYLEEALELLS